MYLLLIACLDSALISLDFRLPTDIQAESIPLILGGGDVLMVIPACLVYSFWHIVYEIQASHLI